MVDYELRRELLRAKKSASIARLDQLKSQLDFLPITSVAMLRAAEISAQSRQAGIPTGVAAKLDIDVTLAAQALTRVVPQSDITVATSNVAHLCRFVAADLWTNIPT